ncbi:MAG: MBL fold metallo-hydrolase [Paraprevotella sp.]|nr:MBL fold metallo-hydrolase [Paraprevotella sp.]
MKITFLGTGTSTGVPQIGCTCKGCRSTAPRDKRRRTSVLVETEEARILIDCGPDFREQILPREFRRIDGVLLTHEHYDHVGGIDDLRPFSVFGDVPVYASERTGRQLRQSLPYCFVDHKYPGVPRLCLHSIHPHEEFDVKTFHITPVEVEHASLPILGYRINNMAYITDMKTIEDCETEYLRGIDLLILNGLRHEPHYSHQTIEEACAFVRRLGVSRAYLVHMGHHIDVHAVEDAR